MEARIFRGDDDEATTRSSLPMTKGSRPEVRLEGRAEGRSDIVPEKSDRTAVESQGQIDLSVEVAESKDNIIVTRFFL